VPAGAIFGRLLHHATTLTIRAESYRLRDARKAGQLGRQPKPTSEEVT
jgi:DNA replication protein DnaC